MSELAHGPGGYEAARCPHGDCPVCDAERDWFCLSCDKVYSEGQQKCDDCGSVIVRYAGPSLSEMIEALVGAGTETRDQSFHLELKYIPDDDTDMGYGKWPDAERWAATLYRWGDDGGVVAVACGPDPESAIRALYRRVADADA